MTYSQSNPQRYYVEQKIIPAKGLVKLKLHYPIGQSFRKTINISGFLSSSLNSVQLSYRLHWTTGTTKIRLICWNFVEDARINPCGGLFYRRLALKRADN